MKKQTMDDYLYDGIQRLDFDGTIELNWDQQVHVFEVLLTMEAQNTSGEVLTLTDNDQTPTQPGEAVQYQDAVLFYDQTKLNGADFTDDYLVTLPFDGKKGISKATVDAFLITFQDVLDDGLSDLMDFLDPNSKAETFLLQWHADEFQTTLENRPTSDKQIFLAYPRY
ncbi:DUF3013 family protein [Agrilactobacillus fermenti]|uniref:DUF3013 family protein n=1 Tax=Agrilactobacillus fermenti TaxID=2586909 RepID=UPI001E3928B1|nr:DUF3013 family protein [Agrilactobacillus fermenti]MCD2255794.1 DUF3013 family protein [Agrilactobacillus fermenti]